VLLGSARQLDLVPYAGGERIAWPSPLLPALPGLLERHRGAAVCLLASGDPMFFGIGATLARLLDPGRLRVLPHPSSASLACARLGWPLDRVEVISLVGRPIEQLHRVIQPDRRVLVLSADGLTPAAVAALLTDRGYGHSELTVLEWLGGPDERRLTGTAAGWSDRSAAPLNVVAVRCRADLEAPLLPAVAGLPDEAYEHDGQLTKREVRATTLARLAPVPGQLLWDVGAGAGSVAIEWMRADRTCQAIAVERDPRRVARIARNANALGVPDLRLVTGAVPDALADLDPPDAVFVGGGLTAPGVLDQCWEALRPGGRLVANAVTVESERVAADGYARYGGELTRIAVSRAGPLGDYTGWRAAAPVTQWAVTKR
jgi:precorrin-6Y C5,15-methyltransferase (decarboxylating)